MPLKQCGLVLVVVGLSATARAQAPDFQVNTFATGGQSRADVAAHADGSFVVVWQSDAQDGSGSGIFGRRFDAAGSPQGGEFQVNSHTTGNQAYPAAAVLPGGGFVVVWDGDGQDGSAQGIFGQRYDGSGAALGPEFAVNTFTTGAQRRPDVGADTAGKFVVAWDSFGQDGSAGGVFGRRYQADGNPAGPELQLNTYTTSYQQLPSLAVHDDGSVAASWQSDGQDGSWFAVAARRVDALGSPLGGDFVVNTFTTQNQASPSLSPRGDGSFVAVWWSNGQFLEGGVVRGQRFDAAGSPQGGEFQVTTDGYYYQPTVAQHADGSFLVAWSAYLVDGSAGGIAARRYDVSGTPQGPRFVVNTTTAGNQELPALSPGPGGADLAVWQGPDGSGTGVFARVLDATSASLAISDASVLEGDSGTTNAVFTVTLTGTTSQTVTVDYTTPGGGLATPGIDYVVTSGTLTFPPGTTAQPIAVPVLGDLVDEHNEGFFVNLSGATNAVVTDGQGYGTILDDDPLPSLAVDDVVVTEGTSGDVAAVFTVSLSTPSGRYVDVDYATADGTATAPADYTGTLGTFEFAPGTVSKVATVYVRSDGLTEGPETFYVNLSQPFYASIADGQRIGTILDPGTNPRGDFSGDGKTDILFRHQTSGRNVVWFMDGILRTAGVFTSPAQLPDTSWRIVGTADFSGDFKTDVLWRHAVSGRNVVWFMNGITRTAGVYTNPDQLPDTNWRMVGTSDFTSDVKTDILWRHAVSGKNVVWRMDGITRTAGVFTNPDQLADTNWEIAGAADFSAPPDAKPDVVWRHVVSGRNVVWLMNGVTRTAGVFTNPAQLADTNWRIAAVGDYSGEGRADLLWRHAVSGKIAVWFMDGITRTAGVYTNPDTLADTNWTVVGPK